jgi:hypothetical protein
MNDHLCKLFLKNEKAQNDTFRAKETKNDVRFSQMSPTHGGCDPLQCTRKTLP